MKIQVGGNTGPTVEFNGTPTSSDIEEIAKSLNVKPVQGLTPENLDRRDTSIMENIFNVPSAAIRSALQGTGYENGAQNFRHIPRFQDLAIQGVNDNLNKFDPQAGAGKRFVLGLPASVAGLAADIATSPADVLSMVAGDAPMGGGKNLGDVIQEFPAIKQIMKGANYPLENIPGDIKKGVMSIFTKDPELAANFVNDPSKYNINPFEKSPSYDRTKSDSTNYMQGVREDLKRKTEDLRLDTQTKIDDMRSNFQDARQQALSGHPQEIQAASQKMDQSLAQVQDSIQNRLKSAYDDTILVVDRMHDDMGGAVGNALKNILNKDPEATLPRRSVFDPAYQLIQDTSKTAKIPFDITVNADGGLQIAGKTANTNPKDVEVFANLWKDLNPEGGMGEYKIANLQVLKEQLQTLSQNYLKSGEGNLGHFYAEMSRVVNPANVISKSPELSALLPELQQANSAYSQFKPKYEEMLSLYTKADANGNPVPDFRKVMNAVENNDVATLQRIRQAEASLPPGDRILPKVESAVKDSAAAKELSIQEFKKTKLQLDLQIKDLDNKQRQALTQERGAARQQKLELLRQVRETLITEQRKIDSHLNFIQDQENLRKWPSLIAGNVVKGVDALASPFKGPANGVKGLVEGLSSVVKSRPALGVASGANAVDSLSRKSE